MLHQKCTSLDLTATCRTRSFQRTSVKLAYVLHDLWTSLSYRQHTLPLLYGSSHATKRWLYKDYFDTKLYQVNSCVGRIAQRQACLGGFIASPSPSLEAFEDEDATDGDDDDDDEDEDVSFSSDDEMTSQ